MVIPRTTWDYAECRDKFVEWAEMVSKKSNLQNCAKMIKWNTDKHYLKDLSDAGVSVAPMIWMEKGTKQNIKQLITDIKWTTGFIKPIFGQSARETVRFEANEQGFKKA